MKKHSCCLKIMSVITAVAITVSVNVFTLSASAAEISVGSPNCISYNQDFYNTNSELCNTLANGMENLQSEIDIEKYKLSINDVKSAMRTVSETSPELFYVSKTTYSLAVGTSVAKVIPKYTYSVSQIYEMREQLNEKTDEILSKIDSSMTDFQKAVTIHDEIILNCEYSDTPENGYLRTSVYDCLVNGYANCQGYASSLSYLLEKVGINSEIVESAQMNHMWNLVEIDGSYYHVDPTFDDPTPDRFGFVSHKYFLLSDNAIKNSPDISVHYGFKTTNTCNSTVFDNSYYRTLNTKFCYINKKLYAADNNYGSDLSKSIVTFEPESNYAEPAAVISDKWYTNAGLSYWQDSFISTAEYDGKLYFNLNNSICRYNNENGTVTRVTDKIDISDYTYIFGFKTDKSGKFYADVKKSPLNDNNIIILNMLAENKQEELDIGLGNGDILILPVFLPGDVNNDGVVSVLDVTLLQMICTNSVEPTEQQQLAADYNNDGKIDVNDATALQIYLSTQSV